MDLDEYAAKLRVGARELTRNLRLELKEAGRLVEVAARAKAAEHSPKVAASILPARVNVYTVRIAAEGALAAMYERGNAGAPPERSTFKHPVFARGDRATWHWNNTHPQERHPFLRVAFLEQREQVVARMLKAERASFPGGGRHG